LKKKDFDINRHCGNCKRYLKAHPENDNGSLTLFGVDCPYPPEKFEDED